mmetsp:Transcript_24298/g.46136  ORF Transcript_24298/g.46136 Transcript_24298/m.46136 type:complete len:702 (+) Transcript_24298:151-2256(+)
MSGPVDSLGRSLSKRLKPDVILKHDNLLYVDVSSSSLTIDSSSPPSRPVNDHNLKAIDAEFPDVLPRVAVSTFNWPVFMYQFWMQMFSPFSVMCHWLRGPKYRKQLINQMFIPPIRGHSKGNEGLPGHAIMYMIVSHTFNNISWLLLFVALHRYLRGEEMYLGWDSEILNAMVITLLQRLTVAFKYAFLTDAELELFFAVQPRLAMKWNQNLQLVSGWIVPPPEVVVQELDLASRRQGMPLSRLYFDIDLGTSPVNEPQCKKPPTEVYSLLQRCQSADARASDLHAAPEIDAGDEGNNRSSNNNNNNKYEDLSWETFFRFDCPPNTPTTSSSGDADQANLKRSGFESAPNSTAARVPAETMCRGLVHRAVRQSPVYQNLLRLAMVECSIMGFAICIVAPLWRSLQMGVRPFNWDDSELLFIQIGAMPILFLNTQVVLTFLMVGVMDYCRSAVIMRDLASMIDTKFDANRKLVWGLPPLPYLDMYTFPNNISSWAAIWLVLDDFGKIFNTRMNFACISSCVALVLASGHVVVQYTFEGAEAVRNNLMSYQVIVLMAAISLLLLSMGALGADLNTQQINMRNKLLKQQLLSRMELKNDDGDPPVKCDSLGSITGGIESSKSASKGRQRSRRKSIGVSNLSEREMNQIQDLLVVGMELLERDEPKRVAGIPATMEIVSSAAALVTTIIYSAFRVLIMGEARSSS